MNYSILIQVTGSNILTQSSFFILLKLYNQQLCQFTDWMEQSQRIWQLFLQTKNLHHFPCSPSRHLALVKIISIWTCRTSHWILNGPLYRPPRRLRGVRLTLKQFPPRAVAWRYHPKQILKDVNISLARSWKMLTLSSITLGLLYLFFWWITIFNICVRMDFHPNWQSQYPRNSTMRL